MTPIAHDQILYRCASCSVVYTGDELVRGTPSYMMVPPCWSGGCSDPRGQYCFEYVEMSTIRNLQRQATVGVWLQLWAEGNGHLLPPEMQVFLRRGEGS